MSVFYEPAFGLDKFRKPLVYEDWEAVAKAIIIVLFGKPGFYPSIPQLGIHIQDYMNERLDRIDTDQLRGQLIYQLEIISTLISTDEIVIKTRKFVGYRYPGLVITIPIYKGEDKSNIAISIVASTSETLSYNYELVDESVVSNL